MWVFSGEQIRKARKDIGWSRPDLVFKLFEAGLRVSGSTILNWESEVTSPGADDLGILARVLSKPVRYFFAQKVELSAQVKVDGRDS